MTKFKPGRKIHSTFALLDVQKGRAALSRDLASLPPGERVKVTITGYFDNDVRAHGNDDGVSKEFNIEVESAEIVAS